LAKLIQLLPLCPKEVGAELQEMIGDRVQSGFDFLQVFTQRGIASKNIDL
jgi:hypothetical protein